MPETTVATPKWAADVESWVRGATGLLTKLITVVGALSAGAATLANDDGRHALGRFFHGLRTIGQDSLEWTGSQLRAFVEQTIAVVLLRDFVLPLTSLLLCTYMKWNPHSDDWGMAYWGWMMAIWIGYYAIQAVYTLQRVPLLAMVGFIGGTFKNWAMPSNPLDLIAYAKAMERGLVGAKGANQEFMTKVWSDTPWRMMFLGILLGLPGYVMPHLSIFIPVTAVLFIIAANNTSTWGNRDYMNRLVLQREEGGVVVVSSGDGKVVTGEVLKPRRPGAVGTFVWPSIIVIGSYVVLTWTVFGAKEFGHSFNVGFFSEFGYWVMWLLKHPFTLIPLAAIMAWAWVKKSQPVTRVVVRGQAR